MFITLSSISTADTVQLDVMHLLIRLSAMVFKFVTHFFLSCYTFSYGLLMKFIFLSEINAKNIIEHCDDLQYLFTSAHIPRITDEFSPEGQTVIKYTKLLHSFAKNG